MRGHSITFKSNNRQQVLKPLQRLLYYGSRTVDVIHGSVTDSSYDVIVASKPSSALTGLMMSKRTGIPVVFDQDDLEGLLPFHPSLWSTSCVLAKKADRLMVASFWLSKTYSSTRRDVVYLPNAVDLDIFDPSKFPRPDDDSRNLLWICPEARGKELEFVAQTMRVCKDAKLVVLGRGGKSLFQQPGGLDFELRTRVEIIDWVPFDQIPSIYSRCTLALLPYPDNLWYRCKCPTKLLEFISMKIPFVATVGEPAYMASTLGSGVVSYPSPVEFARKTQLMLSDIDEIRRNTDRARQYLASKQNFRTQGDRVEQVLLEACRRSGRHFSSN